MNSVLSNWYNISVLQRRLRGKLPAIGSYGGLRVKPQPLGNFCNFGKNCLFNVVEITFRMLLKPFEPKYIDKIGKPVEELFRPALQLPFI